MTSLSGLPLLPYLTTCSLVGGTVNSDVPDSIPLHKTMPKDTQLRMDLIAYGGLIVSGQVSPKV